MGYFALIRSDGLGRCQIEGRPVQAENLAQAEQLLDPPETEEYRAGGHDDAPVYRHTDYYVDGPYDCVDCLYADYAGLGEPTTCPVHG